MNRETQGKSISKGILIAIVLPAIAVAATISALLTLFIARRQARNRCTLSRKHFCKLFYVNIDASLCNRSLSSGGIQRKET